MKIFGVLAILSTLYTQGTSLVCKKVTEFSDPASLTEADDETCGSGDTTCVRPIMDDAGDYATASETVIWGCGECTPAGSCVSCTDEKCNVAPTFTCLATDDFTKDPTQKVCPDIDNVGTFTPAEKKCVRPIMKDGGTYEAAGSKWGCGVCDTPASCVSCETGNCNVAPTFKCLATDDYSGEPESEVCPDRIPADSAAFEPETACVRPKMTDTDYEATDSKWGCGVCTTAAKCVSCEDEECNVAPFKCLAGDADAVPESKFCPDIDNSGTFAPAEKNCARPEFSYAVVGTVKYGCGNCKDGSNADIANCETCSEIDCNSIPTDPKHKCYTYTLGEGDKWAASDDMDVCVSGDGVAGKCNMPADLAVKAGYTEGAGCGPCKDDDDACTTTEAEKNVGQKAVVSLLVTILPLLYVML